MASTSLKDPWPVVAYQAKKAQIIVVGAGGTGGWVFQQVARLVWSFNRKWDRAPEPRSASLLIVDYDLVEEKNVEARQNFCPPEIGKPKALVLANRYKLAFNMRSDEIAAFVEPFSPSIVPRYENEQLTILVGCVDSAEARARIATCLERYYGPLPRIWWIDAGNEEDFGQVLCGNTAKLADLKGCLHETVSPRLPSPALLAPSLVTLPKMPEQTTTQTFSCGDVVGVQQSRTINFHMAALVYGYVDMLLNGEPLTTFATYTNLRRFSTQSELVTPEALARALNMPKTFEPFFTMDPNKKNAKLESLLGSATSA